MHLRGLDALVIYSDEYRSGHSTYLTNYRPINVIEESPQMVVMIGDAQPIVLIGRLNAYAARDIAWMDDIRGIHQPSEDLPEIFAPLHGRRSRVGLIGMNILPVLLFNHIQAALPEGEFVSCDDVILDLRKIKSPAEIELMARAAEINDEVLRCVLRECRVGMTELQVAGIAEGLARKMGADIGSATVVMSGPNTNYPAWRAGGRKIEAGDYVMIDFNPAVEHYCNDGGITILMPGGDPDQERALVAGYGVLKEIIPEIGPHIPAQSIFDAILERLEPHGFAAHFTPYAKGLRGVGHGVGLDVVEPPNLSADSDIFLEPGMTLAIKLDLHGLMGGGYRIEVVLAITEDGNRPLNRLVLEEPDDFAVLR